MLFFFARSLINCFVYESMPPGCDGVSSPRDFLLLIACLLPLVHVIIIRYYNARSFFFNVLLEIFEMNEDFIVESEMYSTRSASCTVVLCYTKGDDSW